MWPRIANREAKGLGFFVGSGTRVKLTTITFGGIPYELLQPSESWVGTVSFTRNLHSRDPGLGDQSAEWTIVCIPLVSLAPAFRCVEPFMRSTLPKDLFAAGWGILDLQTAL